MSAIECPQERFRRIYEYLDGALSFEDRERMREHLSECVECSEEYDLECLIRQAIRRSCAQEAPDALKLSVLERLHAMTNG